MFLFRKSTRRGRSITRQGNGVNHRRSRGRMRPSRLLAIFRQAFRQKEPAAYEQYNAEHRREEREQTTLNLLKAEVGPYRTDRQEERSYRKSTLRYVRATFWVGLATAGAVAYYAYVARGQWDSFRIVE